MSFPVTTLSCAFCNRSVSENTMMKATAVTVSVDAVIMIASLVVGILGALSLIGIPAAAAYSLIGVGGFVLLSHVVFGYLATRDENDTVKEYMTGIYTKSFKAFCPADEVIK